MNEQTGLISVARAKYHQRLIESLLVFSQDGVASNADAENKASREISRAIAVRLGARKSKKLAGQTAGDLFEKVTCEFLEDTFPQLEILRPGRWLVKRVNSRTNLTIADFEQYKHLVSLARIAKDNPELSMALGNDYTIAPDIIVGREPEADEAINKRVTLVDKSSARRTAVRSFNGGKPLLHASISCKWTMRSDRSQNSRSEALNLIRNRKGRVPHIAVVTGEPTPSRLSSLAIGTGDIDCVYHFALPELIDAVNEIQQSEASDMLRNMIDGNRLKDISDLPLDLSV